MIISTGIKKKKELLEISARPCKAQTHEILPLVRRLTGSGARGRHSADFDERKRPNRAARGKRHRNDASRPPLSESEEIPIFGSVWVYVQLIFVLHLPVNQLNKNPNSAVPKMGISPISDHYYFFPRRRQPLRFLLEQVLHIHSSSFAFARNICIGGATTVKLYCPFRGTLSA